MFVVAVELATLTHSFARLLVLMAMEQEARPFIEKHGLQPVPIPGAPATVVSRCHFSLGAMHHSFVILSLNYFSVHSPPLCCCRPTYIYIYVRVSNFDHLYMQHFKAYCGHLCSVEVVLVWAGSDPRFLVNNVATTASTCPNPIPNFVPTVL